MSVLERSISRRARGSQPAPYRDPYARLARWYEPLERLSFGNILQAARVAHLAQVGAHQEVLIVGDGDGRYTKALVDAVGPRIVMLDSSLGMLLRARRRVAAAPRRPVALLGDLHHLPHLEGQFDVVVTHFVLDQWQGSELARVVAGLARVLRPGGWWIWSDFACPERGLGRWRARCALPMLYFAFRRIAEIEARALECPAPHLRDCGLERCATESFLAGFVTSEAWRSSGRVSRE